MQEEIDKLKRESEKKAREAEYLTKLTSVFPDLKKRVERWNKIVYCSAAVNSKVTDYETRHNCGCCSDSPLEFYPYIETDYGRVYSDPTGFFIGERSSWLKDTPRPGWKEELRKHNIPETMIERASRLLTEEDVDSEEATEVDY